MYKDRKKHTYDRIIFITRHKTKNLNYNKRLLKNMKLVVSHLQRNILHNTSYKPENSERIQYIPSHLKIKHKESQQNLM